MGYWEGAGQVVGVWLGATITIATVPVIAVDGPLPIADYAWLYANARNTNNLRKKGGAIGKGLDEYLAGDEVIEQFVQANAEFEVKTPTDNPSEYVFNNLPAGSGFQMGSFLDLSYSHPTTFDMTYYSPEQAEVVALTIAPSFYMFPTTLRESKWPAWN